MPRYYFHTHIGEDVVLDPDGRELADLDAAHEAARVLALQLLQGAEGDPDLLQAAFFVTDEAREMVLEYALTEALTTHSAAEPESGTLH